MEVYKELPSLGLAYDRGKSVRAIVAFMKTVNEMGLFNCGESSSSDSSSSSASCSDSDFSLSSGGDLGGVGGASDEGGRLALGFEGGDSECLGGT